MQQHLLTRPFNAPAPAAEAWLPPGSPVPPARIEPVAAPAGPAVVAEREVVSARELEAIAAQPPPPGGVDAWRTAACDGAVRFETEAIVRVVRDHTNEAGVAELNRKLAAVCRHVVSRRPPESRGPDIVTPATVREVLGDGDGDALPPAVRAAIEIERRRLAKSDDDAAASNNGSTGSSSCRGTGAATRRAIWRRRARCSMPATPASTTPRRASSSTWPYAAATRAVPAR